MHNINGNDVTDEKIKEMINREYMIYFKRERVADIYALDSPFEPLRINPLNKSFNINFFGSSSQCHY